MNWLACSHCGRFHWSNNPGVLDDLGKNFIRLLCLCGRTDAWVWTSKAPMECGVTELRAMRAAAVRAAEWQKLNLRAAALAAATVPKYSPEVLSPSHGVCPRVNADE